MKSGAEAAEALRGIINSGFNRAGANIVKLSPLKDGGWEPRLFSTWCPQVLAGIGKLTDTVADRSICVNMKRKRVTDKVARLRGRDGDDLRVLARKAARWAADHATELHASDPATPVQLHDRAADSWSPLLAIADATGGEWPERARRASLLIAAQDDGETLETILLADIRAAFDSRGTDRLSSQDLIGHLVAMEDRPWSEANKGRPLTKNGLAVRLRPFHISPMTLQVGVGRGSPTPRGYYRRQFEDAFARYLPQAPIESDDLPAIPQDSAENKVFQPDSETQDAGMSCGLKTPENPRETAASCGVADKNTENRGAQEETPKPTSVVPIKIRPKSKFVMPPGGDQ